MIGETLSVREDRVEYLKNAIFEDEPRRHRVGTKLSILDEHGNEPKPLRAARAFVRLLDEMPVYIHPRELIVGARTIAQFPEYLKPAEKIDVNMDCLVEKGNCVIRWASPPPEEKKQAFIVERGKIFSLCINHRRVLDKGLNGIKEEAEKNKIAFERNGDISAVQFLNAIMMECDAAIRLARRYAEEARKQAANEMNQKRKNELLKISETCRNVPEHPARDFWEALQSAFFTHMFIWAEDHYHVGLGRIDQYLYAYLKRDLETGRMTRKEAKDLLECFIVKLNWDADLMPGIQRGDNGQTLVLGGCDKDGKCAVNELSYLVLESGLELRLMDPKLVTRVTRDTPHDFLKLACKVAGSGLGFPMFCNDDVVVPGLVNLGYELEDARDYVVAACWEPLIPGKSNDVGNTGKFSFLKAVELSINKGVDMLTGEKVGFDEDRSLSEYQSFEELMEVVKKQIGYGIKVAIEERNKKKRHALPGPLFSAFFDDPIEQGRDLSEGGGRYRNYGILGAGLANAADSLAVIKRLVFEEKSVSAEDLLKALKSNWDGCGSLRVRVDRVPKYGNDEDYVDALACELAQHFSTELSSYNNDQGGRYRPGIASESGYIFIAKFIGASADGRGLGEPIACNASPAPNRDRKGPTANVNSICKVNYVLAPNGSPLDLRLSPRYFSGDEGAERLATIVKAFCKKGGEEIWFNVVSSETLRDAQRNPDKYKTLMVRVWGFSAYFVELDKEFQEHIIARTEHGGF